MSSQSEKLRIDDGSRWTFVGQRWNDESDGELAVDESLRRVDGDAMQGHQYAFLNDKVFGNLTADFRFRLTPHSDVGLIVGAIDPAHFLVLHFPNCGQASRAQHFWATLSVMDDSGYLRVVKLELVQRVASTNALWTDAHLEIVDGRIDVRIGRAGKFSVEHPDLGRQGRIGIYRFGSPGIRSVKVRGDSLPVTPWDTTETPPQNWLHPIPAGGDRLWQKPGQIVRTKGGDLLLGFLQQEPRWGDSTIPLIARSTDNGRTWQTPLPMSAMKPEGWDGWGTIHVFPDGVLRMVISDESGCRLSVSDDDGRSWSKPVEMALPPPPDGVKRLHPAPPTNLADGSVVIFGYGGHESSLPAAVIHTWGSHHCQAYATRTTDNGQTWSPWVNIDGTTATDGTPGQGNLDFTEICCAQTGDGDLMAFIRPIYSPWMWETWSTDGGASWTPAVRGPFPGYATSNMLRMSSGAILVAHRMPGCTVHLSWDDGVTWDQGTMIDSAIWVMGGMVELEPDVALYVYHDSFESLMRSQRIRVTSDGIEPIREG